jgi:hypothetical protein
MRRDRAATGQLEAFAGHPRARMTGPQLTLPLPRARRRDPATSHAAARSMVHGALTHRARILADLRHHGPGTYALIAERTGLTGWQVTKRLSELVLLQVIRDTGHTAPTPSGRDATVYEAIRCPA